MNIPRPKSALSKEQKYMLDSFLKEFLPARGNKRKNSGNELEYIHTSLSKVFSK